MSDGIFNFPHVRFISHPNPVEKKLHYLGGESNTDLVLGKMYNIKNAMYSENREDKRKSVWYCNVNGRYIIVSLSNFGSIQKLRNIKLNKLLK
jgi:hypothetical protein